MEFKYELKGFHQRLLNSVDACACNNESKDFSITSLDILLNWPQEFKKQLTSALVPSPFGSLDAASRTSVSMVT